MKIGTKSVLFGAHQFILHPLLIALGWWKLYGLSRVFIGRRRHFEWLEENGGRRYPDYFYRDEFASLWRPALWVAFVVHDVGYLGKPNMDGDEGEQHPRVGARIMARLFGEPWGEFVLYHSRFLAKQHGKKPSPLCMADKMVIVLEPWWLYLPRVNMTGEVAEYMGKSDAMNQTGGKYASTGHSLMTQRAWVADMKDYVRRYVDEHRDGREDSWTPNTKTAVTPSGGVWQ